MMSLIEKENNYKITTTSDYTTALIDVGTEDQKQHLFKTIREKFKVEPALGEIMLVRGKPYFTAQGCSRIAETKHVKDVKFEYIDPTNFNVLKVRKNPEQYIIVTCYLTKEDNGVVQGNRLLDLEDEKHWQWGVCCWGDDHKPIRLWGPNENHEKVCSKCKKILAGYDGWKLKDYMNFAETKAFMRAVGKAYNIDLFEELPDDMKKEAKDLLKVVKVEPPTNEMSDEDYGELVNAPPTPTPNAVKEEKEAKTEIVRDAPKKEINIEHLLQKEMTANKVTFDVWFASLKDVDLKGKPAKSISLGAPGLIAEKYSKDGAEPKTYRITNTQTKKWLFVPIWKVNCKEEGDIAVIEIPCELMLTEKDKWEKILA
jgi:hypothetical protein